MAYIPMRLAQAAPANTTEATIYTVPAATSCIVKQIVAANVTTSTATLSISLVASGGTAGDANRIAKDHPLPPNSITTIDLAQVLETGGFISIQVGTANAVTVTASGVEWSP